MIRNIIFDVGKVLVSYEPDAYMQRLGISKENQERIFERFYRTDSSRNSRQGGSGIGLAIVKKIIEDHKGKIWAESVEGEGTAMHINLLKYKDNSHYCIEDKSGKKSAKGLR